MGRLRLLSAGESHGLKICAILEGLPAGLSIDIDAINGDLARRQRGYGRGYRMRKIERDQLEITAGVRFGETLGGPLLLEIQNTDHKSWHGIMDALPIEDRSRAENAAVHRPRPGHADLVGSLKYERSDLRDILERASARNTCVRVAAGAIAKALLKEIGVHVFSVVTRIGGVNCELPAKLDGLEEAAEKSEVRCPDHEASERMKQRIDEAKKRGDTVGGGFAVIATGLPTGWGSYVEWDRRLDGRLAQAVMSIQAVKAVEIGMGVANGDVLGSEAHDEIIFDEQQRSQGSGGFDRKTNRAGGLEGGVTNGQPLVVRGTMKPISTLGQPLESVDVRSKLPEPASYERSDVCAVPACGVIGEAAVALCLADAAIECYGGDTVDGFKQSHHNWRERLAQR